jgi:catechol 2,3-dioxygenase-like lactoylglutathione lyase family enzyme
MPKWLEHTGLSVSDLDRSIAFYRDLLGLRLGRVIEPDSNSKLGEIVGLPGCLARIAHLGSEKGMLELFEYRKPRGRLRRRNQADLGFSHVGFATDDIRAEYDRLRQAGVSFLSAPVEFRTGAWVVYFRGPDGEIGELRQT